MKETDVLIERVRRVNETHQHLFLTVDASLSGIKAGQSLLARPQAGWQPYLREQWWPVSASKGMIVVERPIEEAYEPGQIVNVIGLVGKPYRFRRTLRNVLLIAYNTAPTPLLLMIPSLLTNKVSVTLILLGSAADYGTAHLPPELEIVTGDTDFNFPNRVTTIGWADQMFLAVSQTNETEDFRRVWAALRELRADIPQHYLFGVFRPALPCGVGACQACIVRQRGGDLQAVCTDGPAFDLSEVMR